MIEKFYRELLPDDNYKLIWSQKDKRSHWFQDTSKLIQYVAQHKNENLYVGLCTTSTQLPRSARAVKENASTIRAFHIDIDILNPVAHQGEKLPETLDEAIKIAYSLMDPTYIVDSGHGLHAYYFFDEHQTISDSDYWTMFSQQFQHAIKQKFPQYELDSTHDLPRILRCPGSMNYKDPDNPIECKIIEHNETAYYMDTELMDAIEFDPKKIIEARKEIGGELHQNKSGREAAVFLKERGLILDGDAELPAQKIYNINVIEPQFMEEFNEQTERKSASEYDLALANMGARCGLSDQEIIDLMIHHRRHHGHNLKLNRMDYYTNTLGKARVRHKIEKVEKKSPDEMSASDKELIREWLYDVTGIQIQRLLRYERSPNYYFEIELMDFPGETVHLGSLAEGVWAQRAFLAKISAKTLTMPKAIKAERWASEIIPKLYALVENGISPETATYSGQVTVWAKEFFNDKTITKSYDEFKENQLSTQSFFHENRVYFSYESMCNWIQTSKGQRIDTFHFAVAMSKLGFSQERVIDGRGFELQLWATPHNYIEDQNE